MISCPCCGAPMDGASPNVILDAGLTPLERSIMEPLVKAFPRPMTRAQIAAQVYALDPNGGPLTAEQGLSVHMYYIRKKIQPLGWRVGGTYERGGGRWLALKRLASGAPH